MLPVTGGGEVGHTHVDPGNKTCRGQRCCRHTVAGEHHEPAASFACNAEGFDAALDRAVLMHPHMPHTLHTDAGLPVLGCGVPAAAVAVLGELHRVETAHTLEPGIAGRLTCCDAAEERGALFNRRNVACCELNDQRPCPSGSAARMSRSCAD